MKSKENFVNFGCAASRSSEGDVVQSIYAFTKTLSDSKKLTKNIEFVA